MGYREDFFRNTPSKSGRYRCVCCGRWFPKSEIDVDHRIPKKQGGTDDLYNLQAMCKHCNRSKGDDITIGDIASTFINGAMQGGDMRDAVGSIVTQQGKNVINKKLKESLGKDAGKAVSTLLGINYKR